MLEADMAPEDLPFKTWQGADMPAGVRRSINTENLLNLVGVYADRDVGGPIQYDRLRLVLPDSVVEIEFSTGTSA